MSGRRHLSLVNVPTTVVTISTVLLFVALCNGDILTNSISYENQVTWDQAGITGSVGGLTTREASGLPEGVLSDDYLFIASSTGVMRLNKTDPLSVNNSLTVAIVTSTVTELVSPHLVNRSGRIEFWAPSSGVPPKVARFNTSLSLLADGDENPVVIYEVDRIFYSFPYNGYSYFVAETGIIQMYQPNLAYIPFTPSALPFLSAASVTADNSSLGSTVIFIGAQAAAYRIIVNEFNFQSTTIERYNFTTGSGQPITAVAVDVLRGNVYFAEAGTSNSRANVFRMSIDPWELTRQMSLGVNDFDVVSAVIDPYGLLYLGLAVTPPKVVQISLPSFTYETTLVFPNTMGTAVAPLLDSSSNKIFWSGYDFNFLIPQLIETVPANGCPNMCSGHGTCDYRYCYCDSFVSPMNNTFNYTQPDCFGRPCDFDCNGNGTCDYATGICACDAYHTGNYCDIPQCPSNCTSAAQGTCIYNTTTGLPIQCQCTEGWTGDDCGTTTYLPCENYHNCDDCHNKNPNCGWCSDSDQCMEGNELGPFFETGCRKWHYKECPAGLEVVNYVILIIMIIMFIINMISFTVDDTSEMEVPPRLDWYRFQRSNKAWTLLFQFQFIAACGLFDVDYPTIFLSFTNFWYPLSFGYGLPTDNDSLKSTSRRTKNIVQYVSYTVQTENEIITGVLLWSVVVLAAAIILYLLSILLAFIRGKKNLGGNIVNRLIYVSCRIIEAFYFGMVVFATSQLSQYKYVDDGMLGLSAILLIIIGVGWPLAHLLLILKYQKNLFKKAQRVRYFPMYGNMQVLKLKYALIPVLKKFLLAIFIGFLAENRVPQLLLVWLVHILYFVFVLVMDPFIDILQKYLELFIGAINILSMPVLMGFLKDNLSFDAQVGITVLFTVLQVLCLVGSIAFYFISWSQMHEIFTFNQLKMILCCKKPDPHQTELQRLR